MRLCCFLFIFVTIINSISAQPVQSFHLNTQTGLPSNHVYYLLEDKHGYLWMATDKGVTKYNGYELKKFGLKEGLVNDDVWYLYEDKKGRIWFSALAEAIGYIQNDHFYIPNINKVDKFLRPYSYSETDSGIVFVSTVKSRADDIYFEYRDSFYLFEQAYKGVSVYVPKAHAVYTYRGRGLLRLTLKFLNVHAEVINPEFSYDSFPKGKRPYLFDDYVLYESSRGSLTVNNFRNGLKKRISVYRDSNEYVYTAYTREQEGLFYLVTNKHIFVYNKELRKVREYINDLLPTQSSLGLSTVINLLENSFWERCVATNNGVFIQSTKHSTHASDLVPVKAVNDRQFWVSSSTMEEHIFRPVEKSVKDFLNGCHLGKLYTMTVVNKDSSLIFSEKGIYWLNRTKSILTPYFKNIKIFRQHEEGMPVYGRYGTTNPSDTIKKGMYHSKCLFYFVRGEGFYYVSINRDTANIDKIDNKRYNSFVYDPVHEIFWVWSNTEVFLYKKNTPRITISKEVLAGAGIQKIRQLLIDNRYGNIFILTQEKLLVYNLYNRQIKEIFNNYNLEDALAVLYSNTLIVAGRFGMLCSKLKGRSLLTSPLHYPNIKDSKYNSLRDLFVVPPDIYISTNNGFFKARLPEDSSYREVENYSPPFKFVIKYKDTLNNIRPNDTLNIDQDDVSIELDVINPHGVGEIAYQYSIEGMDMDWKRLANNQIYLPELQPGKYYTLNVTASDAIWNSPLVKTTLYITPFWWQTGLGKTAIWISISIGFLLLFLTGIFITSKLAKRKHAQRTLHLELKNLRLNTDLKSIYAQMHPHFIFNTLSTTAYFIRKHKNKEANDHIVALSKLLRSYITASRRRFITIAEEVQNLENYILLQLERFENKFDYYISMEEGIDINRREIPALLLQPLVENAITHGLVHMEGKGLLTIKFSMGNSVQELICTIEDNGIGRNASKQLNLTNKTSPSFGSDLINELIATINSYKKWNIQIAYEDKLPPHFGTLVRLTIRYL